MTYLKGTKLRILVSSPCGAKLHAGDIVTFNRRHHPTTTIVVLDHKGTLWYVKSNQVCEAKIPVLSLKTGKYWMKKCA